MIYKFFVILCLANGLLSVSANGVLSETLTSAERLKLHVPIGAFDGNSGGETVEIVEKLGQIKNNPAPWVSERYRFAIFRAMKEMGLAIGPGVSSNKCVVHFPEISGTLTPDFVKIYNDWLPIASQRLKLPVDRLFNNAMSIKLTPMSTWIEAEISSTLTYTNGGGPVDGLIDVGTLHSVVVSYIAKAYENEPFPDDTPNTDC